MEDDEKFRQWLEEEYLKEADAIEEALFDGRKFEDNQDIVEKLSVSESFYQRAREEGLLEDTADEKAEDGKNTEEAVPESTEKKILEFRKTQVYQRMLHVMRTETPAKETQLCALWQNRRNRGPVSDLRVRCKYEQRGEPEVSGEQCADIEWE